MPKIAKKRTAVKKYERRTRKEYRISALKAWETRRANAKRSGKKRAA